MGAKPVTNTEKLVVGAVDYSFYLLFLLFLEQV